MFTAKWDDQEGRVKYKARLVARGFTQERGLNYDETYAPTVAREAFRIFLSMIEYLGWELHQMDVKAAFIEGELEELVYMRIPEGLTIRRGSEHLVCRLVQSLYGLKQSARVWNERMTTYLKSIGFRTIHSDASIFWRQNSKGTAILAVHVDDFAIGGSTIDAVEETKSDLNNEFTMKDLGEVSTITGWRVIRDLAQQTVSIDQSAYIQGMLEEYGLQDCKPTKTPMEKGSSIRLDTTEQEKDADLLVYGRLFGQLNWISVGTRPDISYAVGRLGQHLSDPKEGHLQAAKRVLRYLRGIINF